MRSAYCLLAVLALSCAFGSPARAQVPFSACLDRQLQPIPGRVDNTMAAGAMASWEDGHPIILWNQHNLSQASGPAQLFVYLHECAHHNLNHLTKGEGRSIEDQADCWAYQLLVDGDRLTGNQLDALEYDLKHWQGDANHLGEEALLRSVKACVAARTDKEAWDTALTALAAAAADSFRTIRGRQILGAPAGTYESVQGTPGTFDCEIVQDALRCMLYAGRKQKAAEKRFDVLAKIVAQWLPTGWMSSRPASGANNLVQSYVAKNGANGSIMVLGVTANARIYFLVQAARPTGAS